MATEHDDHHGNPKRRGRPQRAQQVRGLNIVQVGAVH
jgi:hypothetical protein